MDGERDDALPPGWTWARLGALGRWFGGGTPSKAHPEFWQAGTIPWVSPKDMKAERVGRKAERITKAAVRNSATKIVPRGSVLCVMRSGILQHTFPTAVSDTYVTLNQDMRALTPACGINSRYLQLYLRYRNDAVLATCAKDGTTVASVDSDKLASLIVPLAPSAEQERIVSALEDLFTQLDEAEAAVGRARELAGASRASLLHAACTGALTADWRAANPNPKEDGHALLRRILVERRAAWERAEEVRLKTRGRWKAGDQWRAAYVDPNCSLPDDLPALPETWTWACLDQLSTDSNYGTSVKCGPTAGGMPVLRIPNVQSGRLDFTNLKFATGDLALNDHEFLAPGDLLVVRTNGSQGLIGRAACVEQPTPSPSYFASYLIRFRLTPIQPIARWITTAFNAPTLRTQVLSFAATSAGQYNVSQSDLRTVCIPVPPLEELKEVLKRIGDDEDDTNSLANAKLSDLRQSILHAAFTGQLVPQDLADEPADALLARLRAGASVAPPARSRRSRQKANA